MIQMVVILEFLNDVQLSPTMGVPGWLLSIHEKQRWCSVLIQHVCGSIPTLDSLGTASANGLYTRETWIYDKRESSSNPEGRAWNLLCVNIQHWPLCTAESVYSNNSRSVKNLSHPCFYSSPASLCTCFFIHQRAHAQIQRSPLRGDVHLGRFVLHPGDNLWVPRGLNVTPGTSGEGKKAAVCILNPENIF